jgi:hypothetical protein
MIRTRIKIKDTDRRVRMLQHCLQVTIDPVNKEARTTDFLAMTGLARPWQWVVRLPFASC